MISSRAKFVLFALALAAPVPRAVAQAIVAVQENGHTVYVNDVTSAPVRPRARSYRLVYWSQTEQRWKPVPGAQAMRAARSAASEVQQYLGMSGVSVPKLATENAATANAPQT